MSHLDSASLTKPENKEDHLFSLPLPCPVLTAPLAGITDTAFRRILRRYTEGLIVTEQLSAYALLFGDEKTRRMLRSTLGEEGPLSVQIFGGDPTAMAHAAGLVKQTARPAVIDINMGCPDRKVMKSGSGAALMGDPDRALRVAEEVLRAADPIPVTVKMRSGIEDGRLNAPELAGRLCGMGIAGLTIHPRTARQRYSGPPNLDIVRSVLSAVKAIKNIPVIASGCVANLAEIPSVLKETGVDGIMLGRPLLGRPWILKEALTITRRTLADPAFVPKEAETIAPADRLSVMLDHVRLAEELLGPEAGPRECRKHLAWYVKGLPEAARLRASLVRITSAAEVERILSNFRAAHPDLFINQD